MSEIPWGRCVKVSLLLVAFARQRVQLDYVSFFACIDYSGECAVDDVLLFKGRFVPLTAAPGQSAAPHAPLINKINAK